MVFSRWTMSAAEWMNQRIHQETLNVSNCKLVCLMCWRNRLAMKGNPRLRPSLTATLYTLLKIIVMSFSLSGWLTLLANEINVSTASAVLLLIGCCRRSSMPFRLPGTALLRWAVLESRAASFAILYVTGSLLLGEQCRWSMTEWMSACVW